MKTSELSFAEYSLTIKDLDVEYLKNFEKFLNGNVIIATKKGKKGKVTELNLAEQVKSINTELNDNVLNINVVLPAGNTGNINPVLFEGEIAIAHTTANIAVDGHIVAHPALLMKVGNGVTDFNSLPWASAQAFDVIEACKTE
jgi:hypothetical protein